MRFGLLYEMEMRGPWNERSEYNIYWQALEQIELGDRLGFDFVWEVEHHFLEEYSHSSAPEVFLGAVSQRTKQRRRPSERIKHGPLGSDETLALMMPTTLIDTMELTKLPANIRVRPALDVPHPTPRLYDGLIL